jgi:hypothetical protein
MSKPTIIALGQHVQKLVPRELAPGYWDLYRWDFSWKSWRWIGGDIGQDTFDRIVDEAEDLAELIDQTAAMRTESSEENHG